MASAGNYLAKANVQTAVMNSPFNPLNFQWFVVLPYLMDLPSPSSSVSWFLILPGHSCYFFPLFFFVSAYLFEIPWLLKTSPLLSSWPYLMHLLLSIIFMIEINTRSFLFLDLEAHNHHYKLSWRQIMAHVAICHRYTEDVKVQLSKVH